MSAYIYNPDRPIKQRELEEWVISMGWVVASMTVLQSGGRLQPHSHHSVNTHWITAGSITFRWTIDGVQYRAVIPSSRTRQGPVEFAMEANVTYRATAGTQGCTFVEAHAVLSPMTAIRLAGEGRGTFKEVAVGTADSIVPQEVPAAQPSQQAQGGQVAPPPWLLGPAPAGHGASQGPASAGQGANQESAPAEHGASQDSD